MYRIYIYTYIYIIIIIVIIVYLNVCMYIYIYDIYHMVSYIDAWGSITLPLLVAH